MKACILSALGLLGALTIGEAQTIPNPSFESNSFTNGVGYISQNTQIVSWTTTDPAHAGLNPVSRTNNPFADNGTVPDGTNVAFIQGGANSSLSTVISNLTVGETYKVNFRVNASSNGTPNLKVDIAGANVINAAVRAVGGTNAYKYFAFDFTAAATSQTVTLRNDAGTNDVVLVDNFSIGVRNSGWSYAAWNDDASSGVVASNHYTHAYNFGSSNNTTINGVTFTNTGSAVTNPFVAGAFSTAGLPNVFNNDTNAVNGASAVLAHDFLYGGSNESLTIYGLVPGKSYRTTIYSVGFDTNGARAATFSVGTDRLTVNQDQFGLNQIGSGKGIWVSYYFTAASTSNTITYAPLQGSGQSFYTCGFCNCEAPPLQIVNPSFEADTYTVGPGYTSDNFPITGWNGVGHGVNPAGGPFTDNGAIPDGTKAAFIQGDTITGNGFLTQVVHGFTNGATYQVRYFENGRLCCSNVPFAEVRIGGQAVVARHAVPPVGNSNPYRWIFSDPFVAANTSLELAFVKSDPQGGDNTLLIDSVSIGQVTSNAVVFTQPADAITTNSARLNGQVSPQGSPTTAWFQWGTDTNYGSLTAPQAVGSSWAVSNLNAVLGGLQPINYHYRLVASNAFGITAGVDQGFTIPSFHFSSISGLPGVSSSSVAWGDFDNDGRLDFLITGSGVSQLWRNTGSGFTNVPIPGLAQVDYGSVAWGDFDNDGRLDFLITGYNGTSDISQLWRNTGSGFSNVTASIAPGLPGVESGSVAWGDFDNDGRLDFLITGYDGDADSYVAQLWRNTGSGFSDVTASVAPGLPGVEDSSVAWGDFDNDGRLDFLIAGLHFDGSNYTDVAQLWRNTGGGFANVPIPGLPGVDDASVAWGDFDNDGRLDFLIAGTSFDGTNHPYVAQLWRNTGSGFSNVTASLAPGLPGADVPSVAWGDYDNDGRLDFLITGLSSTGGVSQLWRNTGSGFVNVPIAGLPGVDAGSVAWGDFDNDGRLDLLITGDSSGGDTSQLWQSVVPLPNAPPAAPTGLSVILSNNTVILNWNAPADDHTLAAGLSYNVRIGTTPGGSDVVAPQARANGARLVPQIGNAGPGLSAFYELEWGANYYCSVQAVDTSFAGSPFSDEAQLTLLPMLVQAERLENGVFQFSLRNNLSGTWLVRATTNLALPVSSWDNLGFATPLGGGLYQFDDSLAPYYPKRFYRLQKQ